MRKIERIRLFFAACYYYTGLVALTRWRIRHSGQSLIILNYHSAKDDNLRSQIQYLRRYYRIMHLDDALDEFYSQSRKGQGRVRDWRIPLVLTFDDGYLDNYTHGLRLVRELHVPITIFLIPGYVESGAYFWWLAGEYLLQHTKVEKVAIEGRVYRLHQDADRQALLRTIDTHLRHACSIQQREAFLTDLQQALEVHLPTRAQAGSEDTSLPLTWKEIQEMEQSGLVSFGAHTMHHPVLAHLTDVDEIKREVTECRQVLEHHLGHPIRSFAYPIGKMEHIGDAGLHAVSSAGYDWAVTTIEEVNMPGVDPYQIRRLPGDTSQHWLVMAAELTGLLGLGVVSRIKKKFAKLISR